MSGSEPSPKATDVAIDVLREAILSGRLGPGQRLKESQLAKDLGISRTPVREALRILEAEGLVDTQPNRGAAVRSYSRRELADIFDARAVLEGHAARRAAAAITPRQLEALHASCDRFDQLQRDHRFEELSDENLRFHFQVTEAAGSRKLSSLVRSAVEVPLVHRAFKRFDTTEIATSGNAHRRVLAALENGDGDRAETIMKDHIYEGRDRLVAYLRDLETRTG